MKKSIFIIVIFSFFLPICDAENLQNLYLDNYKSIVEVDESEVFSRIKSPLSDEEEKFIINKKLPEKLRDNFSEYTKYQLEKTKYEKIFDFEKTTRSFEENLVEELTKLPIYSNEVEGDGKMDLIKDLNDIDVVLFGEHAAKTNPSFAKNESKAFSSEEEPWQVGDENKRTTSTSLSIEVKKETSNSDFYSGSDHSVAGNLEAIRNDLTKLASKSLAAECTATKIFEPPFLGRNLSDFGSNGVLKYTKPQKPKPEPEVYTNKKEIIANTFLALEKELINELPCEEKQNKIIDEVGLTVVKDNLNICRQMKQQNFERDLESIYKRTESISEKKHYYRIAETLNYWQQHFSTFLTEVTQMRKFLDTIAEKPKKN